MSEENKNQWATICTIWPTREGSDVRDPYIIRNTYASEKEAADAAATVRDEIAAAIQESSLICLTEKMRHFVMINGSKIEAADVTVTMVNDNKEG